jgi:undecaprenyl pyrophosphate phosphatase UppP
VGTESKEPLSTFAVMVLTVVGGVLIFFMVKWFLSFILNHLFLTLVVAAAALGILLYAVLPSRARN